MKIMLLYEERGGGRTLLPEVVKDVSSKVEIDHFVSLDNATNPFIVATCAKVGYVVFTYKNKIKTIGQIDDYVKSILDCEEVDAVVAVTTDLNTNDVNGFLSSAIKTCLDNDIPVFMNGLEEQITAIDFKPEPVFKQEFYLTTVMGYWDGKLSTLSLSPISTPTFTYSTTDLISSAVGVAEKAMAEAAEKKTTEAASASMAKFLRDKYSRKKDEKLRAK